MSIHSIGAVLLFADHPEELVTFYRQTLGMPLVDERHEGSPLHHGCTIGNVHFAIHDKRLNRSRPGVAFSLTTTDLDRLLAEIAGHGVRPLHRPVNMGDGAKRVTILDPAGNAISLVQLANAWRRD